MSAILKALQNRKVEVELKSEVVELGKVQDLLKVVEKSKDKVKQAKDVISRLQALKKQGVSLNDSLETSRTEIGEASNELKSQLKALGMSEPPVLKNIGKDRADLRDVNKQLRDLLK